MMHKSITWQLVYNLRCLTCIFLFVGSLRSEKNMFNFLSLPIDDIKHAYSDAKLPFSIKKKQKMKIIHIFLFSEAFSGRIEKCNQVISVKQQEK